MARGPLPTRGSIDFEPFRRIALGGRMLPGRSDVTVSVSSSGDAPVTIVLTFAGARAALELALLKHLLEQLRKDQKTPIDADHPSLKLFGIRALYIDDVSEPQPGPEADTLQVLLRGRGLRR